jgi:hypothetical protein
LIDEAQQTYHDKVIKKQSGRPNGVRIALFSSFGSPTEGLHDYSNGSAPVHFGVQQRVSIVVSSLPSASQFSLFYSFEEFEDVAHKYSTDPAIWTAKLRNICTPLRVDNLVPFERLWNL